MQSGLYTAASGLMVSQHYLDIVSNNLANMNTVGFKKDIPFVRHLETALSAREVTDEINKARNAAVKIGGAVTDITAGVLKQTGNKLDLAITGRGFFAVLTPNGVRYTKAGNFTLSSNNVLQTVQGYPVLNERLAEITVFGKDVKFDDEGGIIVDNISTDKLIVYDIPDQDLIREGHNLFYKEDPEVEPTESLNYTIHQGFLEMSNVSAIDEMVRLIELTRSAQFYQKMITATMDTTTQRVINQVGVLR